MFKVVIGIDCSNIRRGGGITHILNVLREYDYGHDEVTVIVWGSTSVIAKFEDRHWLVKRSNWYINYSFVTRFFWQTFLLASELRRSRGDILFVPGGTYLGAFKPFIAVFQNMLPFDRNEFLRFDFSALTLKFFILRFIQGRTFVRSNGLVVLSDYAQDVITSYIPKLSAPLRVIPHGISKGFRRYPNVSKLKRKYTPSDPCRIVYVSIIDMYKHQWNVAYASILLRRRGYFVDLSFIGPSYPPALAKLNRLLLSYPSEVSHITVIGEVEYNSLQKLIHDFDIFLFASSCENLPNILIEGMSSGIPIACTNKRPMTDILLDGGLYFDCMEPESIANTIEELILNPELRREMALKAFEVSCKYSWRECSTETFNFIRDVSNDFKGEAKC
jgi:glycosyltransferase involved in cell wall biosynthesis